MIIITRIGFGNVANVIKFSLHQAFHIPVMILGIRFL